MAGNRIVTEGRHSRLNQKLREAIQTAMFTQDPAMIRHVLSNLSEGIGSFERSVPEAAPFVKDEDVQKWVGEIKALIAATEKDEQDPAAKEKGLWYIRARRMTVDEKIDLARLMMDLHGRLNSL